MRLATTIPVLFGVLVTVIAVPITLYTAFNIFREVRAQDFPTTTATITHSEITRSRGGRRATSNVDIRYTFDVDGQTYEGDTYRYNQMSSSDRAWTEEAIALYPLGAKTMGPPRSVCSERAEVTSRWPSSTTTSLQAPLRCC
jgi:hypothetical protein